MNTRAQNASDYSFSAFSGTFTPLVGGTATTLAATADDNMSAAFPIGFSFRFAGSNYTQVMASSNGQLLFGTGKTQTTANNLATTTASERPGVAPLWDDIQCTMGVTYQLSGTAPNQVLTVEWLNMEWNYGSGSPVISFQVKLYEGTNAIEFIYRQEATAVNNGSSGASIGIMGTSPSDFISLQNTSASPTISKTASTNNIGTKPATGQVYQFVLPPCAGAPVGGTTVISTPPACGGNFTLNVLGSSGLLFTGNTLQWQDSIPGGSWTNVGIDTPVYVAAASGIAGPTYFRRNVTCTNSGLTESSAPVLVLPVMAGTANSTNAVCGDSITLNLAANTTGPGTTFQWEESIDSVNWSPVFSATSVPQKLVSPSMITFYRAQVICGAGNDYSVPVKVLPVRGGTAASTPAVCGDSITLSVSGSTTGTGLSYQWEESTDSVNWSPIGTALSATSKVPSPTIITYYRLQVTCGIASDYSVPTKVLPVKGGITTITSSICNDSTLLSLSGASTGVTYQWLSSTDSITWTVESGATASTYKFPTPSVTMYYRALVSCGPGTDSSVAAKVTDPCEGFRYSITRNTGTPFNSIQSTGNTFNWASTTTGDDDRTAPVYFPAGFNFTYNGAVRPAFYACTNGWLTFDTATLSTAYTNNMGNTTPKFIIAPFWEDLVTLGNTNANKSYIRWEVSGTAPSRVMTVEWGEMERYNYSSPNLNFQVKFYEGSNNIEYVYGRMQPFDGSGSGDFSYSLGMTGNNIAAGQRMVLYVENTSNFRVTPTFDNNTITPQCNTSYLFTAGGTFNPTATSAIPANDSSSSPVVLTVNPVPCTDACGTYYASKNATASGTAIAPVSGTPDDDVWFSFTAPPSGEVNISVFSSSGYNPAFQVMTTAFDTTGLGAAASVNNNTNALENVVASGLTAGNDYLIRVFHAGAGFGSVSGAFSICVNEVIPPPANDDTTGAIALTVSNTCAPVSGTTLGSTASPQAVCGGLADDDVWFKFTPINAVDTITVTGTGTFRPHVQILSNSMASLYCQNTTVNAGTVKITATGLLKDSIYWVRVYHTNAGTASANFDICITADSAAAPLVRTEPAANIVDISAQVSGTILSSGGFPVTASGIVYSTTPMPVIGGPGVVDSTTNPVVTNGSVMFNIEGLSPLTTYYYRVYATNGMGTTYGGDSSFTTTAGPVAPTVVTLPTSGYSQTTATISAEVQFWGGAAVTASGILFGTSSASMVIGDPSVTDSTTGPVVTSGPYSFNLSGLTAGTLYYFRAYAINAAGTGYSDIDSFMTDPIVAALPYVQDFEPSLNTGWYANALNNWVLGTPAKTFLNGAHSGNNAWVTNLTGVYNNNVTSSVVSPQFDFTNATTNPVLRFHHKFVTEANWDGLVVEMSIGGGPWNKVDAVLGSGLNYNTDSSYAWYNHAGGSGPIVPPKFSSNNTGEGSDEIYSSHVNGWIESATVLTGAAGQQDVRVRFTFGSDLSGQEEGWAIDDITIEEVLAPSVIASSVMPSNVTNTTTDVAWTNGNGVSRMVIARHTSDPAVAPTDMKRYNANPVFGNPDSTGLGNYVVFNGPASDVSVSGLDLLTDYTYDVYEYNGKYMHLRYSAAASASATTLPVELMSFSGTVKGNDVLLSWATASENNNKGFEVERSADGRTFEYNAFVKGAGNSNRKLSYTLSDDRAFAETRSNVLYYRLKQVDMDGTFAYSHVVKVTGNAQKANAIAAYPNPFNTAYSVSFNAAEAGTVTLKMVDLQGKVVAEQTSAVNEGMNAIAVENTQSLKPGVYFVKVTLDGETQVLKLVKH